MNMTGVLMRRGEEAWRETFSDAEAERAVCLQPRACHRVPAVLEARRRQRRVLPRAFRVHSPLGTSISDFQPENCTRISVVLSHPVCGTLCYSSSRKLQMPLPSSDSLELKAP